MQFYVVKEKIRGRVSVKKQKIGRLVLSLERRIDPEMGSSRLPYMSLPLQSRLQKKYSTITSQSQDYGAGYINCYKIAYVISLFCQSKLLRK